MPTPPSGSLSPPSEFLRLALDDERVTDELCALEAARDRGREQLRALLREAFRLQFVHLWHPGCVPVESSRFPAKTTKPADTGHRLVSWRFELADVVCEFAFFFRGEVLSYSISLPLRYLEADAEAVMRLEAEAELHLLHGQVQRLPEARRSQAVLETLMARHPARASDILDSSTDVAYRLKVSATMRRALLDGLGAWTSSEYGTAAAMLTLRQLLATAHEAALGNLVTQSCRRVERQPPLLRPGMAPYVFRNFLAAPVPGMRTEDSMEAHRIVEELGQVFRDVFEEVVYPTYMVVLAGRLRQAGA